MKRILLLSLVVTWTQSPVCAAIIDGPSSLLTQGYADQLETWLGEGSIKVTRIYAKSSTDTSADFHAAVDGKGRTFSLIEVLAGTHNAQSFNAADLDSVTGSYSTSWWDQNGDKQSGTLYYGKATTTAAQIIGGYNPQSWDSAGHWHFSLTDAERTAFLYK